MSAALKMVPAVAPATRAPSENVECPVATVAESVAGKGRLIAAAKFRELASLLERGLIDGARCQWLDQERETSEMQVVVRSADTHEGKRGAGFVRLTITSIEEV